MHNGWRSKLGAANSFKVLLLATIVGLGSKELVDIEPDEFDGSSVWSGNRKSDEEKVDECVLLSCEDCK